MCLCGLSFQSLVSATDLLSTPSVPSAKKPIRQRRKSRSRRRSRSRSPSSSSRSCSSLVSQREWHDGLIFSNVVYALAGVISLCCGQYFCALFQIGAAIASTMFHRSKETKYLLVDALISSTLLVVFVFFANHVLVNQWYGILVIKVVQGALCIFTWLYCGLPGGERYDVWHLRWHYVSGITTISTTLFLAAYVPHFDLILHELVQDYMIVTSWL